MHSVFVPTCVLPQNTASYVTPHLRTNFAERAFSFAGPAAWNSLPAELRSVSDRPSTVSKNKLKTHLFKYRFLCSVGLAIFIIAYMYRTAPMFLFYSNRRIINSSVMIIYRPL